MACTLATAACKGKEQKSGPTEGSAKADGSGSAATPPPPTPDAPPPPAKVETAEQMIDVPFMVDTKKIKVKAKVPVDWKQREGIPTWDPPDAMQLPMWHRSYEIVSTCDGGCTPKELADKPAKYLDAIKARHEKPKMSGDPVKDENTVAPVKSLERGELPQGGMFELLRVEKPVGSTDPYPDVFVGTCITRRKDDEFMVVTRIQAAPDDEKTWWPVLVEACKATTIDAAQVPAP